MIGDPVALTIRRKTQRPTKRLLEKFRGRPTGFITDARNGGGCMDYTIKPLVPEMRFCGPAATVFCPPMYVLAAMASLDFVKPGDVIVIATAGNRAAATIGDLWLHGAKAKGVAAVVCDGMVRDATGLLKVGLPVFARGVTPNSGFRNGPGEINTGVTCGGVFVGAGDIVAGDRDGVVVVPLAQARAVAASLAEVERKEAEAEARIARGEMRRFWSPDAFAGRVRFLD